MRILFVIPRMNGGGAERMVANLSNYLASSNDVTVLTFVSDESFYELDKKIKFVSCKCQINRKNRIMRIASYAKSFPKLLCFLRNQITSFKPDCVISMLVAADIMTYLATIGNSVVKIYSERNDPTRRNAILRYVLRRVYRKADMFICQSKKVYDYYVFIPKKRKKIIPNMLDLRSLPAPCIDEENHTIVSVGRLTEQKNFEMLIEAFKEAMPKIPDDSNLVIYGAGPLEEKLAAKIKNEGLSKKVFLKGAQSDVLNKMAGCALFVLPSLYEGFPNVLLEAMAVGLPVISTDFFTGVAKELIKKENGIIVAVGDEKEMAKAIVKIMNDDMMRKKCRMNNVEVMGLFGAEKVGEEWKKMIIGVVRGKNV